MSKKLKIISIILILLAALAAAGWVSYRWGGLRQYLLERAVEHYSQSPAGTNLVERALGLAGPRAYLVLFLNNTELRPGGGFIGAYATVQLDQGKAQILKVEGTELIDNSSPAFAAVPPAPLGRYLGIKDWRLRDSNWSPDFKTSAITALQFYRQEQGVAADRIDAVVGFTPTVIERLLAVSGPLIVDGKEFTSANFTERLEYEVEYGYVKEGITFDNRKKLLVDFTRAFARRFETDVFRHWSDYLGVAPQALAEKQILLYSTHADEQQILEQKDWAGLMKPAADDAIMWVDANLGSLKTDAVIDRSLSYSFQPVASIAGAGAAFAASVTMHYRHRGHFDWRTSRYRDYARLYVPLGSVLTGADGAMAKEKSSAPGIVDQGIENGRQWFGAFIAVEPGEEGSLTFHFNLAPAVARSITENSYALLVQKQSGAISPALTLGLNFGTNLIAAAPPEAPNSWGDPVYDLTTDLRTDRTFTVTLK